MATSPRLICASGDLLEGGAGVRFSVPRAGGDVPAFAVRFDGVVRAYLNRCAHVPMEMDYQENRFFDDSGRWLMCATHGATYAPDTGTCVGGPCRGGLVKIALTESDGMVHWHTAQSLKPVDF